jgi:hypothetical protein
VSKDQKDYVLKGTTLRVYRYMYRTGTPLGIHDVQRGLELSSPSVAEYHIRKLASAGLIQERESGYTVDRVMFENMIRIRRTVIPFQTTYAIFFAATLVILLVVLRPTTITSVYVFAVAINTVALLVSIYEAIRTFASV